MDRSTPTAKLRREELTAVMNTVRSQHQLLSPTTAAWREQVLEQQCNIELANFQWEFRLQWA